MGRWSDPNMLSILIILIVSFTILNWTPVGGRAESIMLKILTPVASLSRGAYQGVTAIIPEEKSVENLKKENAAMREQIIELKSEIVAFRELENLTSARVAIPNSPNLIKADVIFQEAVSGNSHVIVNIGDNQNVQVGQPAVNRLGLLVGVVISTENRTSRIQLLNDVKTSVPVISGYSRTQGLLTYNSNIHSLRYISKTENIIDKELILTSALGGQFPYGIMIGTVTHVADIKSNIMLEVNVEIMADLHNIDRLYILDDFKPWLQPQLTE
jgi:rod shape-determining protein MreC